MLHNARELELDCDATQRCLLPLSSRRQNLSPSATAHDYETVLQLPLRFIRPLSILQVSAGKTVI